MANLKKIKKIDSLTGGRFIAIMIIMISHLEFLERYPIGSSYKMYFHNATMGVDYFFMLSGFGMMLSFIRRNMYGIEQHVKFRNLLEFAKNHIKKIYGLYLVMILIGAVYYFMSGMVENDLGLVNLVVKALIKFIPSVFLLQSTLGMTGFSHAFNGVSWFLSTLFCIYLVSPVVMKWLNKNVRTIRVALFLLILITLFSVVLAIFFSFVESKTVLDDLTYGSPYRRILYVIFGMVLAIIYDLNIEYHNPMSEYLSILLSVVWFISRNSASEYIFDAKYVIDMLLCGWLLYSLAVNSGKFSKLLSTKKMVYLGEISMYLFLTHYMIRFYADFFVRQLHIDSYPTVVIEIVAIFILSFLVSSIFHRNAKRKNQKFSTVSIDLDK